MDIFVVFIIVLVILVVGELGEKYIESRKRGCMKCKNCSKGNDDGE